MTGWLDVHMARSPDRQKSTWPEVQMARRTVGQKARLSSWIYGLYKVYKTNSKYWCSLSDPSNDMIFHPNYCLKCLYWIRNCFEHFPISTTWNVVFVTTHLFFLSLNAEQKNGFLKAITAAAADLLFSGWPLLSDHFTIGAWGEILVLNWAPPPPHGRSIVLMPFNPLSRFGV